MPGSLNGPRLKVGRAKKHIEKLDAAISGFLVDNPYEVLEEPDPEFGGEHGGKQWRIRVKADPPDDLALLAGDAIHNLRSALDLLVGQLVIANGKDPKREAFPIGDTKTDFETGRFGIKTLKGRISSDAIRVMRELQPYQGGNDSLWRLHKLDIVDKHRLLLVVGGAFMNLLLSATLTLGEDSMTTEEFGLQPAEFLCPLKDGDIIPVGLRQTASAHAPGDDPDAPTPEMKMNYKFAFAVAIHESGVAEREPLVPFLNHLASTVDGTIAAFEPLLPGL